MHTATSKPPTDYASILMAMVIEIDANFPFATIKRIKLFIYFVRERLIHQI